MVVWEKSQYSSYLIPNIFILLKFITALSMTIYYMVDLTSRCLFNMYVKCFIDSCSILVGWFMY